MPSLRPVVARIGRRLSGSPSLAEAAAARREIAPADASWIAPAIHLPDEEDRIRRLGDDMPLAKFKQIMAGGWTEAPATVAYLLRDALVVDHTAYGRTGILYLSDAPRRSVLWQRPHEMEEALLTTTWVAERYFGHWLSDGLLLEMMARDLSIPALSTDRPAWSHEAEYRERCQLYAPGHEATRVGELWWTDDAGVNADRRRRMGELRQRFSPTRRAVGAPVFIRRVGGADRHLANQDAIAEALVTRGFEILTPETASVAEMQDKLGVADLVVSVEGSALYHAVVGMAERGTILTLQPPRRVTWVIKAACDSAGLNFAYTICDQAAGSSFFMPLDRLFRTIDLIADRTATRSDRRQPD